jgi:hypothetical protein
MLVIFKHFFLILARAWSKMPCIDNACVWKSLPSPLQAIKVHWPILLDLKKKVKIAMIFPHNDKSSYQIILMKTGDIHFAFFFHRWNIYRVFFHILFWAAGKLIRALRINDLHDFKSSQVKVMDFFCQRRCFFFQPPPRFWMEEKKWTVMQFLW